MGDSHLHDILLRRGYLLVAAVSQDSEASDRRSLRPTAPYDLRHGFGSNTVEASGGNLNDVAHLLGHRRVTTTNRYVHSNQRAAETVIAAVSLIRGATVHPLNSPLFPLFWVMKSRIIPS